MPQDLEGAIVSGHYFLFTVNKDVLLPEYLSLVVRCNSFAKQVKATGSTNYAAIRSYHVLNYKIPLPSVTIQEQLIQHFKNDIAQASEHERQAKNLDQVVEDYFMSKLGLLQFTVRKKKTGLQIVNYFLLDRWDFSSVDTKITSELKRSVFPTKSIGSAYIFVNRSWNKNEHFQPTFRYIEIGAIDTLLGITGAKEINTKKAPSRATQIIKTGDLLIATTRPYLKKFVIVPPEFNNCICSSGFSVIESSENYNLHFLKEFLMCSYGIEQLKSKMTGALYPAITERELKDVKIPFPNVQTQNEIMNLVNTKRAEIIRAKDQAENLREQAIKIFQQAIFPE